MNNRAEGLRCYLRDVAAPLANGLPGLSVVHLENTPLPGEHLFVITPPLEIGRLMVGTRGATAQAFRVLARAWCKRRGWDARIDVRVKKVP